MDTPLFFLKTVFWLALIFKARMIAYDQLARLIVKKPSDISKARRGLDFNPKKLTEEPKLFGYINKAST